jgi:3-oxo-5-alpha-steroid 4-dehydrogenase 1
MLHIYDGILIPWTIFGLLTACFLLIVKAPYGKFVNSKWGPQISFELGWILQEAVSPLVFTIIFLLAPSPSGYAWFFCIIWNLHYFNRSFFFPLRKKDKVKKCPLIIVFSAISFNIVNGFINGYFISHIFISEPNYFLSANFIVGSLLLIIGAYINIVSDNTLIKLKNEKRGYKIPYGFMYKFISCPNYFGEILQWLGFYLMTLSPAALIFFYWTIANLIPRAISNHNWYEKNFENYPKRKALIPFLL